MTKQQFIDNWLPYWMKGDEPEQFRRDLDALIEQEIYNYVHSEDGLGLVNPGDWVIMARGNTKIPIGAIESFNQAMKDKNGDNILSATQVH